MKSLNVKKLAALAVGATMVLGTAAAAVANNLPTDRSWYLDSKIVVGSNGSNAAASDVVSAAEISAAIAQLAYKKAEIQASGSTEGKVKIETPSSVTTEGEVYSEKKSVVNMGYREPDTATADGKYTFSADTDKSLENVFMYNNEIHFKARNGTTSKDVTADVSDSFSVTTDVFQYVPQDSSNAKLLARVTKDGVEYEYVVSDAFGDELTADNDYNFSNFYVDLLGKHYEITKYYHQDGNAYLAMVGSEEKKTLAIGDSVDFEGYIKLVDINPDKGQAYFQLLDANGNVVDTAVLDPTDNPTTDFDGTLKDPITVKTVFAGTENKFAEIELKSDELDLEKGVAHDFTDDGTWKISWTIDDSNNLVFTVKYTGDKYTDKYTALGVGDIFRFPGDKYGFAVEGFVPQNSNDEMYKFYVNKDEFKFLGSGDDKYYTAVAYNSDVDDYDMVDNNTAYVELDKVITDDQGRTYDFKVVFDLNDTDSDGNYDALATGVTPTVYYKIDGQDTDFKPASEDVAVAKVVDTNHMELEIKKLDVNYGIYVDVDDAKNKVVGAEYWLDGAGSKYTIKFDDADKNGKLSDKDLWTVDYSYGSGEDEFNIPLYSDETETTIDFKEHPISVSNAGDYSAVDYESDNAIPENLWTKYGAYVDVDGASSAEIKIPSEPMQFAIAGGEPSKVVQGGYIEVSVGQTIPNTDYKIVSIETGAPQVSGTYYEEIKDLDPTSMVYLDTQEPSGNLIVVGGYAINQIAAKIQQLKQDLTKENTVVVKYYPASETGLGSDAIVVAGWTAQDTMTAARQFIQFLKTSVQ